MQEYLAMWKNYVNFKDRTTVRGYWMVVLFNIIIAILVGILTAVIGEGFSIVGSLYSLATLIPGLAICVRRLHDINKSGWWLFISLVPLVGAILLIVWYCKGSVDDNNRYGTTQV